MRDWSPDTCSCVITITCPFTIVDWIKKCELHKNFDGTELLKEVLRHNNSFNLKFGSIKLTERQKTEVSIDKSNEKRRVRSMGNGVSR